MPGLTNEDRVLIREIRQKFGFLYNIDQPAAAPAPQLAFVPMVLARTGQGGTRVYHREVATFVGQRPRDRGSVLKHICCLLLNRHPEYEEVQAGLVINRKREREGDFLKHDIYIAINTKEENFYERYRNNAGNQFNLRILSRLSDQINGILRGHINGPVNLDDLQFLINQIIQIIQNAQINQIPINQIIQNVPINQNVQNNRVNMNHVIQIIQSNLRNGPNIRLNLNDQNHRNNLAQLSNLVAQTIQNNGNNQFVIPLDIDGQPFIRTLFAGVGNDVRMQRMQRALIGRDRTMNWLLDKFNFHFCYTSDNGRHAETKLPFFNNINFNTIRGTKRPCLACSIYYRLQRQERLINPHIGRYWNANNALWSLLLQYKRARIQAQGGNLTVQDWINNNWGIMQIRNLDNNLLMAHRVGLNPAANDGSSSSGSGISDVRRF